MTLTFPRTQANLIPRQLQEHIVAGTGLPIGGVEVDATSISVDGSISEANRAAIQARIDSYIYVEPGTLVVAQTSFGQAASAGDATTYSRSNHNHGTPALGGAVPQALGTATAGSSTLPARQDHVHPPTGLALSNHNHDAAYSPIAHDHDNRYYTEAEADARYALTAHSHAGSGGDFLAKLRQSADVTNATVTLANCPGLVFTFTPNAFYAIDLYLLCTSVAATTGYTFAFDVSVAVTSVGLFFSHQLASAGTVTSGMSNADANRTGLSSGVPAAGSVVPVMGQGILVSGATGGTCQLQFAPEVAASATCRAGSLMRVMAVA